MIRDLIRQTDQNGNPKVWTSAELTAATDFVNWQTENFGSAEARAIIDTLQKKYNVFASPEQRDSKDIQEDLPEIPGVHGLL